MRGFVTSLAVALLAWPAAPGGARQGGTGRITGRVTLVTRVPSMPLPAAAYPSRAVSTATPPGTPEVRNVVVYLKTAAERELPLMKAEIAQQNETFVPHVVAITRGSSVDFPNQDPFFHNVFSLSRAASFDLGRYPRGDSRARRFNQAGLVKVYCHIHSHMSAAIMVFDHPFFVQAGDNGTFRLDGIAPGRHQVVAWHERAGEQELPVTVAADGTATVNFSLPLREP